MKNYLILYLLLFNLFCHAQNSDKFYPDQVLTEKNFNTNKAKYMPQGFLVPVQNNSKNSASRNWLLTSLAKQSTNKGADFSSMTLIEQLRQLDQSTPFNVVHNATIERFIRVYLENNRENLGRMIGKSAYYFPLFEQYLDREELPIELKYLAVVESALNQVAVSPSGAKGLWQFMYGTGKEYGLHIDSYVDERFDLRKSTSAACAYLQYLHNTFKDWDLALAAYNSGPGNVRKAIKRAGGNRNYWEIRKYLPKETSSYVPAFYATMYLFTYADFHDLSPQKQEISYALIDTVQVKGPLSFSSITTYTGMDASSIRSMNPQYKKDHIPELKDKTFSISLPIEMIPTFLNCEQELYHNSFSSARKVASSEAIKLTLENSYLVQKGDNLQRIANTYGIRLEQLKKWNGLETNFLIAGQRLVVTDQEIKSSKDSKMAFTGNSKTGQPDGSGAGFTIYTVKNGDTLFKISRKFGNIPITEIRDLNGLENVHYLKPGRQLKIKWKRTSKEDLSLNKS